MSLQAYLGGREQVTQAEIRQVLDQVLPAAAELRRLAVAALDQAIEMQHSEPDADRRGAMEEAVQTLGAIRRELDNAVEALRTVRRSADQLDAVEERLAQKLSTT